MSNCSRAEMAIALSSGAQSFSSERIWPVWFRRPMSTLFMTSRRPTMLNCWNTMAQRMRQSRQFGTLERRDVATVPGDAAFGHVEQTIDHPEKRRFARARATDHPDEAARSNRKPTSSTAVFAPKRRDTP